jgi:hypothetical protein
MLPFTELKYNAIWFPMITDSFKFLLQQHYGSSKYRVTNDGDNWKYKLRISILEFMVKVSFPLFAHLHKRGIFIMIGVPNDENEYSQCIEKNYPNIDAIMTDRPALLRDVLISKQFMEAPKKK